MLHFSGTMTSVAAAATIEGACARGVADEMAMAPNDAAAPVPLLPFLHSFRLMLPVGDSGDRVSAPQWPQPQEEVLFLSRYRSTGTDHDAAEEETREAGSGL